MAKVVELNKNIARIIVIAAHESISADVNLSAIIILKRSDCLTNIHLFSAMNYFKNREQMLSEKTMAIEEAIG